VNRPQIEAISLGDMGMKAYQIFSGAWLREENLEKTTASLLWLLRMEGFAFKRTIAHVLEFVVL